MLRAFHCGDLEIRAAGKRRRLTGSFPYNRTATLSNGGRNGRPKKERFKPHSLRYNIEKQDVNLRLLSGHEYSKPLADRASGSLVVRDTPAAVTFEAVIPPEMETVSWVQDALAGVASGLIRGISIGFMLPPRRAVERAEEIEEEPDDGTLDENGEPRRGAIIRNIHAALLWELSLVTAPSYEDSEVSLRNWQAAMAEAPDAGLHRVLNRWRP